MHLIITDAWFANSRAVYLSGSRLAIAGAVSAVLLMGAAASFYHWILVKTAGENWPVLGSVVKLVVKDDAAQRDRFMRANIELMAKRLGEMQAKLMQLESLGERVSGLAGVKADELKTPPGRGGALVASRPLTLEEVQGTLLEMEQLTDARVDWMTVMESRLFDQETRKKMIPTQSPLVSASRGSAFGWRIDPFNGRGAWHTGLDFPGETGTPILAAAGGVVVTQTFHPAYGNMVEVQHGNRLVTRYAHASKTLVKKGDLVKRGQKIAEVGSTGRSTGPHLHFEVLAGGVFQDPQKFLNAGRDLSVNTARASRARVRTAPAS